MTDGDTDVVGVIDVVGDTDVVGVIDVIGDRLVVGLTVGVT